jgi:hypothetical protein
MKVALSIAALYVLLVAAAHTQEQALSLTLLKTSLRTQNNPVTLSTTAQQVFLPTVVTCPVIPKNACTLKIEVSGAFVGVQTDETLYLTVTVIGTNLPAINPDATIPTCPTCNPNDTRTFQWMQRNVPAGTKATVTIQFSTSANYGTAVLDRTESIELFKN